MQARATSSPLCYKSSHTAPTSMRNRLRGLKLPQVKGEAGTQHCLHPFADVDWHDEHPVATRAELGSHATCCICDNTQGRVRAVRAERLVVT
eukprot:scaffold2493_cov285-Prasinococcus_capsulatus_cf.AAC.4